MLSRLVPGQYRAERARANVVPNELGPMLSEADLCLCRVEWVLNNVEQSRSGSMSSRPGPGQCRVEQARADVKLNWPDVETIGRGPISSRPG